MSSDTEDGTHPRDERRNMVTREKYDRLKARYQNSEASWQEMEMKLKSKVIALVKSAENRHKFHGRNKMNKKEFDGYDHANSAHISHFLKNKFLPHHKFPHSSWIEYAPDDEGSFFCKIRDEVDFPQEGVLQSVFWDDNMVPMVNKKLIEWRSNANSGVGSVFSGMSW